MARAPCETRGLVTARNEFIAFFIHAEAAQVGNMWVRALHQWAVVPTCHERHATAFLGLLAWDLVAHGAQREGWFAACQRIPGEHTLCLTILDAIGICNLGSIGSPLFLGRRRVGLGRGVWRVAGATGRHPAMLGSRLGATVATEPLERMGAALKHPQT